MPSLLKAIEKGNLKWKETGIWKDLVELEVTRKIMRFGIGNLTLGKDWDTRETEEKEKVGKESGRNEETI